MVEVISYLAHLRNVLLPGLLPGSPTYGLVTLTGVEVPDVPRALPALAGVGILVLSAMGMIARRRDVGGLTLLFVGGYLVALTLWPWKHERFVWPLSPLVWVFVPAGIACLARHVPLNRSGAYRLAAACGGLAARPN